MLIAPQIGIYTILILYIGGILEGGGDESPRIVAPTDGWVEDTGRDSEELPIDKRRRTGGNTEDGRIEDIKNMQPWCGGQGCLWYMCGMYTWVIPRRGGVARGSSESP